MHYVDVKMKDGTKYCAPIYMWRPQEGWFSLMDNDAPDQIRLADVESAIEEGQRVTVNRIEDADLLAKARRDGWDGK
jgi:hypothetical protein